MAFTWTELLDDIKVRAMMPTSQSTFTAARLLSLTNASMRSKLLPLVDKVREGYYEYDVDTTLNATGTYYVHTRAVGAKILDAALLNGNERLELTRYYEKDVRNYTESPNDYGFFIKRNAVYLLPATPSGWTTLRQKIMLRPPEIVEQTSGARVSAINTTTGVVTCETVPATWTTGSLYDMVQEPAHFDTIAIDLVASAVVVGASGTLTFTPSALPSRLAVGDWIGLAGQSPVIQLPVELNPLLAQETANVLLKSQNDEKGLEMGLAEAKRMKEEILSLITPRVQSAGKKITNRTGILRRGF